MLSLEQKTPLADASTRASASDRRFFEALDGIRGVCAISVVFYHIHYFRQIHFFKEIYLAVDIFFLLSGIVIANAYSEKLAQGMSVWRFMWYRTVRIYPLYLTGTIISLVIFLLAGETPDGGFFSNLSFSFLLLPNILLDICYPLNLPAWSLFVELVANLVFAASFRYLSSRNLYGFVFIGAALVIITSVQFGGLNIGFQIKTLLPAFARVWYSFFCGVLLFRLYKQRGMPQIEFKHSYLAPWVFIGALTAALCAPVTYQAGAVYDPFCVILIFPALIFFILFLKVDKSSITLFKFLGMISFPIYALHFPIYLLIQKLIGNENRSTTTSAIWIAFVLGMIPISWLVDKYFDIPIRRYILAFWKNKEPQRVVFKKT